MDIFRQTKTYAIITTFALYKRKFVAGEELFLVTKLPPSGNRPEAVAKFLKRSLDNLQVSYLDLYLIHTPFAFKDIEGDLHPIKDGKIDFDPITDHVAIWKVGNPRKL